MKPFYAVIFVLSFAYGISFPLLAVSLEAMGANARIIGLSAAGPALGWLLATPFLPALLRRLSVTALGAALLIIVLASWGGIMLWQAQMPWIGLRFFFGGALGLFFRIAEYWLTRHAPAERRGASVGYYSAAFLGGLICGALAQGLLGTGMASYLAVGASIALALGLLLICAAMPAPPENAHWHPADLGRTLRVAPLALLLALAWAFYEEIPATLLAVFALRLGMGETAAALTLSASALGALVGSVPAGLAIDRFGRRVMLRVAALTGLAGAIALPFIALHAPTGWFLAGLFFWSFGIETIFVLSLVLLADRFRGEALLRANISYGVVYSVGALIGPLYAGALMDQWNPTGVFMAAASIFLLLTVIALRLAPGAVSGSEPCNVGK